MTTLKKMASLTKKQEHNAREETKKGPQKMNPCLIEHFKKQREKRKVRERKKCRLVKDKIKKKEQQ